MDNRITAQLVEHAMNGDEAAIECLYHLHCRRVYALCLRMTSNQAEAEDLTQEAFLQAFRKLSTFRGQAAFSTWIYQIATNAVLVRLRRKTHLTVSLEEVTKPNGGISGMLKSIWSTKPTRTLVDRLCVRRALDQLPEGYRRAVVLHDVQGSNDGEIAEITGHSAGNFKSQLHKARERLREMLSDGALAH